MAAALERAQRRYVVGGPPPRGAGRGGALPALAAPQVAHASRPDVSVGGGRPRQSGFRYLDENGYAVHRQLVARARLEDSAVDHTARAFGKGSLLSHRLCT